MRLLKYDSDGGVSFANVPDDKESEYRYAILSHTWGAAAEEVTFDDISNSIGTSKRGYEKIKFCVDQTRQDGLQYFWVDTCCINKADSSELSEALISMFRWYSRAEKCYVFLSDVPLTSEKKGSNNADWEQDVRFSRWFRRGWTLQELLAPPAVEFFSRQGKFLGTKKSLECLISEITRIPVTALRRETLFDCPLEERRQWQDGRQTHKEEDMVYSLFGLLEVSMPVLYGEKLQKATERLEEEINKRQKGARYQDFSLPFSLSEAPVEAQHFVARERELREMRSNLSSDGSRKAVILHGLGGIGKTQLAMAYAKRHRHSCSALIWLNAKDEYAIKTSFAKVAKQILREYPTIAPLASLDMEQSSDQVIDAVKAWLSSAMNTRWLMICDNYDNPSLLGNADSTAFDIRQYLPEAHQGSVIITTRSSEVALGHCIHVRKFDALEDGLKILEYTSGRGNLENNSGARQLAEKLDGLALALATAGAYLSQSTITFAQYLEYFEQSWDKLLKTSPALMTYGKNDTLYTTWQVSFEQIERKSPVSASLLRWWAYFDNQDLWFELLDHSDEEDLPWIQELTMDRLTFEACVRVLRDHGLVEANVTHEYEVESMGYSVHACVHSWMKAALNPEYNGKLARLAVLRVSRHVPDALKPDSPWIQRRLLNHAIRFSDYLSSAASRRDIDIACQKLGDLYRDQDKLTEAEAMYTHAMNGCLMTPITDERLAWDISCSLGKIYQKQNKLAEAEEAYAWSMKGYQATIGVDWLSILIATHGLGNIYASQAKLDDAEEMYKQVLKGYERALGKEHRSTLSVLHDLGRLHIMKGTLSEAEDTLLPNLDACERIQGKDHTLTVRVVFGLSMVYQGQGKLAKAEDLGVRAVAGFEKALGENHSETLLAVHYLGKTYRLQLRMAEAEVLLERAAAGYEKVLGPIHRDTLQIIDALGELYSKQGKMAESEKMYMQSLQACEKAFGPHHTDTLRGLGSLALLYYDHGRMAEAEEFFTRVFKEVETADGPDNNSTLWTMSCLGTMYKLDDRLAEATPLFARVQQGYEMGLASHETWPSCVEYFLGLMYNQQAELAKAEELFSRAQKTLKRNAFASDTSITRATIGLGCVYARQGRMVEASEQYQRCKATYGKQPHLQAEIDSLGQLLSSAVDKDVDTRGTEAAPGRRHPLEDGRAPGLEGGEKAQPTQRHGKAHGFGKLKVWVQHMTRSRSKSSDRKARDSITASSRGA